MSNARQSFRTSQAPTPFAPEAAPVQSRGSTVYVYGDAAYTRRLQQRRQHRVARFPYQHYRRDAYHVTAIGGPHGLPAAASDRCISLYTREGAWVPSHVPAPRHPCTAVVTVLLVTSDNWDAVAAPPRPQP